VNRIDQAFQRLRSKKEKALIPYIMAGDPSLERTGDMVLAMERAGADIIELGVPFSDPIADGPVIQRAGQRALRWKTALRDVFRLVVDLRGKCQIPLILMTYYNPIHRFGINKIFEEAATCGVDGLIIPDLPPEEGGEVSKEARRHGIRWILLAAPTTPPGRLRVLCRQTEGFLYYVSLTGITGAPLKDFSEVGSRLSILRKISDKPVAVGFGVSTPEQAREVAAVADGVIIGSAIVRLIEQHLDDPDLPRVVEGFVKQLKDAVTDRRVQASSLAGSGS
jgi:tryptophan synthase alpha chain